MAWYSAIINLSSNEDLLINSMKMIKIICIGALLAAYSVGCAVTQNLPSVTLGPKANSHNKLIGASVSKEGVAVVAPLIEVSVPTPSLRVEGDKKKK